MFTHTLEANSKNQTIEIILCLEMCLYQGIEKLKIKGNSFSHSNILFHLE